MTTVNPATGEMVDLNFDDVGLLSMFQQAEIDAAEANMFLGKLEQEIHRRLIERGADKLYGKGLEYVNTAKPDPDRTKIPALMEYLTPAEVENCLMPAHWGEPVEPKWIEDSYHLGKVGAAIKDHGGDAQVAFDAIYFKGAPKGKLVEA